MPHRQLNEQDRFYIEWKMSGGESQDKTRKGLQWILMHVDVRSWRDEN